MSLLKPTGNEKPFTDNNINKIERYNKLWNKMKDYISYDLRKKSNKFSINPPKYS